MGKKVEKVLERTDDLRNTANVISEEKDISYEDAFAEAKNKKGVTDMSEIAEIEKYGEPSYYYKEAVATFGDNVNGVKTETISPEKLEGILTADKIGAKIEYKKGMSKSDIKSAAIENRRQKEKTKEKDKVLIFTKPKNVKDIKAA